MSEILTIEGHTYTPLIDAAQHFGYTKEYLLMHVRDNKFDARKVDGKWYVNLESAQTHYENARRLREEKRRAMMYARQAEYKGYQPPQTHHAVAIVETLAIVLIGLTLGAAGYFGTATPITQTATVSQSDAAPLAHFAHSLYALVSGADTSSPKGSGEDGGVSVVADEAIQEPSSLVVAPATSFTVEEASSVHNSFSDPVTVTEDPNNPDMGVITPVFKEGREGEEYRYLLVPVREE